jgi:membrane protein DedA with SNARE-associated domain
MIANGAGAVVWTLFYGLGAYYFGKGVEEFAQPFAIALAVLGAIVVVSMVIYWRREDRSLLLRPSVTFQALRAEPSREAGD